MENFALISHEIFFSFGKSGMLHNMKKMYI